MLRPFSVTMPPEMLVDGSTGDDAAVWRLDDSRALVVTADFITPVVDDAFTWGRIAAANSVSDVYAMGGSPILALNLAAWNNDELPLSMLEAAFEGVQSIAREGGFVIAGGHTITDPEPKIGLAVVGLVDPARLLTNAGLRDTQVLILTKPLGLGVVTTAIKRGLAPDRAAAAAVTEMTRLNRDAARIALASHATGATDVTGFGLLGHLGRMARESGVDVTITSSAVPLIDGAHELAAAGVFPGGAFRNLDAVTAQLDLDGIDELWVNLLADPQTSGGLVFGVDPARADHVLAELSVTGHHAAAIGTCRTGTGRLQLR